MLERILAGLRVLDLTQNVAGPFCAQTLGDLGAQVIKVERPGTGDDARAWRAADPGSLSAHFVALNRNKRSICIDLGQPEGQGLVARLAASFDVFLHSMKPGSAQARGLDYETLSAHQPRLVYCAISAYGEQGPLKDLPGYDPVLQAFSGLMSLCGHPDDAPSRVPVSIVDLGTGLWATLGIVGACLERARTGQGAQVQTSLLETSLFWMNALITAHAATGQVPRRLGSALANAAPYELFRCADGYAVLAAPNDRLFGVLCRTLGCDWLPLDERFSGNAQRLAHREALHTTLETRTLEWPTAALVDALREAGLPCGEMNTLPQAVAHPQTMASGMLGGWAADTPGMPPLVEMPLRMNGLRSQARAVPPTLGADTDAVLHELGCPADEIERLRRTGTIA